LVFIPQTIGNACGTIGLYHALANNEESIDFGTGVFGQFIKSIKGKNPNEIAHLLENDTSLATIHEKSSLQGQTEAPDAEEDVNLHFVCFVEKNGHFYEMDGRNPFPIHHGPCIDLLSDSAKVIQKYMALSPNEINFTVMAFAAQHE
jgi:ubiquitin carboxyl-terminal hydrolase L3